MCSPPAAGSSPPLHIHTNIGGAAVTPSPGMQACMLFSAHFFLGGGNRFSGGDNLILVLSVGQRQTQHQHRSTLVWMVPCVSTHSAWLSRLSALPHLYIPTLGQPRSGQRGTIANYPTNTDPDCIDRQQIMNDPVLGRVWQEMGELSTVNSLLARYIKCLYM